MKKKENQHNINNDIKKNEVKVVGSDDYMQQGIYDKNHAINVAEDNDLDLVEVHYDKNENVPVCRIMDYNKFLYDQKKKEKKQNTSSKNTQKEIRFTPNISDHDFDTKVKQARKFFDKGNSIKTSVFFKGRNIQYKERGEYILYSFAEKVKDIAKIPKDLQYKFEGNKRMVMYFSPLGKNQNNKKE